jgi:hypothetical protein
MVLLGGVDQEKDRFSLFGDMLILMQDRCTSCAERTIGLEIIWGATDVTPT